MPQRLLHADVTEQILQSFYVVYGDLGYGFLEKVYENAMCLVLRKSGLEVLQQHPIKVFFDESIVGEYFADLVVSGCVVVELKSVDRICPAHEAQLLNYLRATEIEVGMLLNFGQRAEFRRRVFANERKMSDRTGSAKKVD